MLFLLCLAFFWLANFTSFGNTDWLPWTIQTLAFEHGPDPVLPFTLAATFATAALLFRSLYRAVGAVRAALIAFSTPVGAVGAFELLFQFLFDPANFWIPAHLDLFYWGYALALASFALFAVVGSAWWSLNRTWWGLLAGAALLASLWKLVGFPLPVSPLDGHVTPSWELGIALGINVALKWGVFALLTLPILNGAGKELRLEHGSTHDPVEAAY